MMKTKPLKLFISRKLYSGSPLLSAYSRAEHRWTDIPLLTFSPVDFIPPKCDWLFFYSPRAVEFFCSKVQDIDAKVICYAQGTANTFRKIADRHPDLITTGESESSLPILLDHIKEDSICFVRGRQSVRAIQKILPKRVTSDEVIVYDSILRDDLSLDQYDVAFITSPLSFQSFYQNGGSARQYITIGQTTKAALLSTDINENRVTAAAAPSEDGMLYAFENIKEKERS